MGKTTITQATAITNKPKDEKIGHALYMEDGASIVCEDRNDDIIKRVAIIPQHIDMDADIQLEFPRFTVNKTTSRVGQFGMHSMTALVLDTDEEPTEGSKNLLTSGTIYEELEKLKTQIEELRSQIR